MQESFDWEQKSTLTVTASATRNTSLPRVLLLGDSISMGYTPFVVNMLEGTATVKRPACNCGPSNFYLENDKLKNVWLEDGNWNVIHVNFGIWDNHYMCPNGDILLENNHPEYNAIEDPIELDRVLHAAGGGIRNEITTYMENTRKILAILKDTGATVIFALTTPVPHWRKNGRWQRIRAYNDVAQCICREMDVQVNDLFSIALEHLDLQTDGAHFTPEGYQLLANAVVSKIKANL